MGPDSFDCSGLTMRALAAAGITAPRTTGAQATAATPVPYDQVVPGDLIFYGTPGAVTHVALATSATTMIEAPRAGVPVREVPLRRTDALPAAGRIR